jgi:hypothetical protein
MHWNWVFFEKESVSLPLVLITADPHPAMSSFIMVFDKKPIRLTNVSDVPCVIWCAPMMPSFPVAVMRPTNSDFKWTAGVSPADVVDGAISPITF